MIDGKIIKEILRERAKGSSLSQISARVKSKKSTVNGWLKKVERLNLTYEGIKTLSNDELEILINGSKVSSTMEPKWETFIPECSSLKLSVQECFEKYIKEIGDTEICISRSSFYRKYREHENKLKSQIEHLSWHNSFLPAEVAMIDYSGDGLKFFDRELNKDCKAEIFVAVLGCSGLLFCYATINQKRESWFSGIAAMYRYFGGVTDELWLDNSTPLVKKADKVDPTLSPEFISFCEHYQTAPIAVAPGRPTYKGLVENAVGIIQRRILKPLNERKFFSIEEINRALLKELDEYNLRPITNDPCSASRRQRYEEFERGCLKPLPSIEFRIGVDLIDRKVLKGNQVRIDNVRYHVPWGYEGKKIRVAINHQERILTFYDCNDGSEILSTALRDVSQGNEPMRKELLPDHLKPMAMTREELVENISQDRPTCVLTLMQHISRQANSQAKKHLRSLMKRFRKYEDAVLEQICTKALNSLEITYKTIIKLCDEEDNKVAGNKTTVPAEVEDLPAPSNGDVRGKKYFQNVDKGENQHE